MRTAPNGVEMPFDLDADLSQTVLTSLDRLRAGPANGREEKVRQR
ncbi:hypothetical protein Salmuc_03184 [Salipiger mucosus DSM 16094]|uniref:Uncharacterized protein n=1 Tax=Salipiger mucosus DSM 16094 TaxID=1123237 RepID=S9RBR1_9RHOB|nr:hypothetical protein Salmuc_03184 [Salipiger mucosus DSM 16094]